eukprot:scaffold68763_cov59-Attheya_sp.AAC.1
MASGFGLRGGIGRCYPFFADYKECLKEETSKDGVVCFMQREDYFECLHNRREFTMVKMVNDQAAKLEKEKGESGGGGGGDH